MTKLLSAFILINLLFLPQGLNASTEVNPETKEEVKASFTDKLSKYIGLNYNSFFYGPGIGQPLSIPPAMSGQPADYGLNFFNLISVQWKASQYFSVDLQFRNQIVLFNQTQFRHQGQRLGVSATFLKGSDWSLSGALNSDIPIPAIMGQIPSERSLIFNPGLFGFFNWAPTNSRWSLFALLAPRVWFYRDREAVSLQDSLSGGTKNKPEYTIYVNPSVNYSLSDTWGLRFGTTLEFTKFVGFDHIKRNYMPVEFGVTYKVNKQFNLYVYSWASTPIDDGLRAAQGFSQTPWYNSLSINMWLSGVIF